MRRQAEQCARHGSRLTAALLTGAADNLAAGGVVADLLVSDADEPSGSVPSLRLAGALHRLVLERRAPELALHYPSVGGTAPAEQVWPVAERTCHEHLEDLRLLVRSPVQTNEVGRAAALYGVLVRLTSQHRFPLRLLEIGASAGLNLHLDRFAYAVAPGTVLGDPVSPVRLVDPWRGAQPPYDVVPSIVERAGCDSAPLDPATPQGRLTLTSYVWADQVHRLERLRGAFEVAARSPVAVQRADASDFLRDRLAGPAQGAVTVVWHSVVRQYLSPAERDAVDTVLRDAGARASPGAPLVHVGLEPERVGEGDYSFRVRTTRWPGGHTVLAADCQGHGPPVTWH
jgi:hypothetical protein